MGWLEALTTLVTNFIATGSYAGVVVLMGLESANIPIPSEVVLPFAGFLAATGVLNFWLVVLAGAVGCTLGSALSYYLGRISNDTWIQRFAAGWGRFLITTEELTRGDRWLKSHGGKVIFGSRLLPVVRTFISFPAGMSGYNFGRFIVLSFTGSLIWSLGLVYLGYSLGNNWTALKPFFQKFDYLIIAVLIISLVWFVYHRGRKAVGK